jgi:hypothetical protein
MEPRHNFITFDTDIRAIVCALLTASMGKKAPTLGSPSSHVLRDVEGLDHQPFRVVFVENTAFNSGVSSGDQQMQAQFCRHHSARLEGSPAAVLLPHTTNNHHGAFYTTE